MLMQKTFIKKTRRGKIIKVVREHYLRNDIICGLEDCPNCAEIEDEFDGDRNYLSANPVSKVPKLFPNPHYLVIDTNVVLEQIDVLESKDGLDNIVILQTVLEEVRHRSSPIYKRLIDVIGGSASKRRFFVFVNEHRKETYVERLPGESPNDRNDRAIRTACAFYSEHLKPAGIVAVLISDDVENRKLASGSGISAFSLEEYVGAMSDHPGLYDKLRKKDDYKEKRWERRILYPEHLSPHEINARIKSGKLLQGAFYVNRTNFMEATVNASDSAEPILIQGLEHLNRSVDGDVVAVELLDKSKWSAPSEVVLEDDDAQDPGDTLEDGKKVQLLSAIPKKAEKTPTGRVVGIVKRKWRQYCGILQPNCVKGAIKHIFVPAERKIPKIRIETRQAEVLKGQRIIVAIDSWPRYSRYPLGHFVRALGPIGDKATENEVLLLEHDIPHSSFSEDVLECLPEMPWLITPEDEAQRVDCRHLDICSVDPPGCTDIDDALHCRELPNGNLEVGVHIADVSHFIRPGTAIDKEAANRSTTVYLTDRRIDMVPELLSSNLCSLRGGVDRFAFSCIWEMNQKAEILSTKFHKSIIKSRKAMTYEEAQNKINDPKDNEAVTQGLRRLLEFSKILKKRRTEKGSLTLASSEIRFSVDSETADPIDVQVKQVHETNSMVEEFMLAANISAAKRIYEEFPDCAMLRRHPAPPPSNFDPLVKAGKQQGFEIDVESNKTLAKSLDKAVDPEMPFFNTMLRMIATRCMMQAVYFASGTIEEPLFTHYGLACPIYTHFTSPIRRYADIIVHRLLAVSIGADSTYPELLDKKITESIANNINYRHRMAQYASRASVNLHTHIFFRNRRRDEDGYILFVRKNAIQVLIPKYGLEGTLYLEPQFTFDESVPSQTLNGVDLTLFQRVKIQLTLDTSNVQHEKLIVRLVEPVIEGFSVPPVEGEDEEEVEEMDTSAENGTKRRSSSDSPSPTKKKKSKKTKNS